MDDLDLIFRLEKHFGIRLSRAEFFEFKIGMKGTEENIRDYLKKNKRLTITAGDIADVVLKNVNMQRRSQSLPEETDLWPGVRDAIARTAHVDVENVTRESRLYEDLGFR